MTPADGGPDRARRTIALVHYAAPPVVGGVERVLGRHAVLLADAGHEVRVIAGRGGAPDPRVQLVAIPLFDPCHPTIARLQHALDAGNVPADFPEVVASIVAVLDAALAGVDIVVAHNVCSLNLNLALTAALREVADRPGSPRLILWHHDLAWASPLYHSGLHAGMPWDLLRMGWQRAVQVVVSEARRCELAALAGLPAESIAVVPNGVDPPKVSPCQQRTRELMARGRLLGSAPLLLMPSRITPRKNIELAIRVVASLRAAGHPAGLVVTGPVDPHQPSERAYLDELRRLRKALALEGCVRFLSEEPQGPPSDAVMHDLYRLADLLFLPSRDEGFGLPILEAAANRLPIVCAELPALRELAGDAALYIGPDDDPAEVATLVLERVAGDGLGRLVREVRTKYAWAAVYRDRIAPLLAAN